MANPHSSTSSADVSPVISAEELRRLFHYDPDTGIFTRRVAAAKMPAGSVCGCLTDHGYLYMRVPGKLVAVHRMAWLYVHGYYPKTVDHINGNRTDNRLVNLRDVTQAENSQNMRRAAVNNKTGLLGVTYRHNINSRNKYLASITANGKRKYLGYFPTAEEAYQAYVNAKRELHPCGTL